jgi:hypothetical protein
MDSSFYCGHFCILHFSSSKSYSRNTLGKKVRHWGLNPWPPECPRGLEFNMNSKWILQSPTELLVNSRWIQDLTFGDFSCCIRLIWVAMKVHWIVQNEAIMFVTKLYYYHLSNQSIINLCQISTKVPKITYLLCRFSVYYHQALCLLWLWVYCYQNTKCAGDFKSIRTYQNLHWKQEAEAIDHKQQWQIN